MLGAGVRARLTPVWPEGPDPRDTPMETAVLRERLRRRGEDRNAP